MVSDYAASCLARFFIPNPNNPMNPTWETGTKTFKLTDAPQGNDINANTLGEENYEASGTIETVQENIISVRNARVDTIDTREERAAREFVSTDTTTVVTGEREMECW